MLSSQQKPSAGPGTGFPGRQGTEGTDTPTTRDRDHMTESVSLFRNLACFTFQHMHSDSTVSQESTYCPSLPRTRCGPEKLRLEERLTCLRRARALTLNGPGLKHHLCHSLCVLRPVAELLSQALASLSVKWASDLIIKSGCEEYNEIMWQTVLGTLCSRFKEYLLRA